MLNTACWLDADLILYVAVTRYGKFECNLCNNPEERSSHLLWGKSFKSCMENLNVFKTFKEGEQEYAIIRDTASQIFYLVTVTVERSNVC